MSVRKTRQSCEMWTMRVLRLHTAYTNNMSMWACELYAFNTFHLHLLLSMGMSPNERRTSFTPVERSIMNRNLDMLQTLISSGGLPTGYAVHIAVTQNQYTSLDLLIAAGANTAMNSGSLARAVLYSKVSVVSTLLSAGAVIRDDTLQLAQKSTVDSLEKVALLQRLIRLKRLPLPT